MYQALFLPNGYAMLMRPNKAETAVHGCHCPGDMRKVLARRGLVFESVTSFYCFFFSYSLADLIVL